MTRWRKQPVVFNGWFHNMVLLLFSYSILSSMFSWKIILDIIFSKCWITTRWRYELTGVNSALLNILQILVVACGFGIIHGLFFAISVSFNTITQSPIDPKTARLRVCAQLICSLGRAQIMVGHNYVFDKLKCLFNGCSRIILNDNSAILPRSTYLVVFQIQRPQTTTPFFFAIYNP